MKKNILIRLIAMMLALLTAFSFSACDNQETDPTQTQAQPQRPSKPTNTFVPTSDFVIVYGEYYAESTPIQKACKYLKTALFEVYGILADVVDDTTELNAKKEFLVGNTNRTESEQLATMLSANDYAYHVASENSIAICGGLPDATYTAVKKFCTDVLSFDGSTVTTPNAEIKLKTKYEFFDTYTHDLLFINGILWEDYRIVISTPTDMLGAIEMNKYFGKYTGQILPVLHASEITGTEEALIRIGSPYRTGRQTQNLSGYIVNVYKDSVGIAICIDATTEKHFQTALEKLLTHTVTVDNSPRIDFTLSDGMISNVLLSSTKSDFMDWTVAEESTRVISDGVTYTEQLFYDDAGLPYRVYTLVVDTNINKIEMGTSNDGYAYTVPEADRQTTQQHMEAAVKNGKNVIAGINADFFHIGGDYRPWGLTIKDGKLLNSNSTLSMRPQLTPENIRPFFGFTTDGKPLIAMENEYSSNMKLDTAVGGAHILAKDGHTIYYKEQYGMGHGGVHPRALVGYREDGTVILMVIDGRQEKHSNGASFLQCSLLMNRFGASDVLLLDGGGSSCMVLRDPVTKKYTTVDKPSDGQLRKIYNSLLVIKK